jgi:hypothetical protein
MSCFIIRVIAALKVVFVKPLVFPMHSRPSISCVHFSHFSHFTLHPTTSHVHTVAHSSRRPERRDAPHSSPAAWSRRRPMRGGPYATPTHHLDAILDLKAIEFPQPMLASASRDGVIKVWA